MSLLKVAVRVRPFSQRELANNSSNIVEIQKGNVMEVTNLKVPELNAGDSRDRVRRFSFDYCFSNSSTQTEVYNELGKEIENAIMKRQHACVLAYGQSASGKTHTIMGDLEEPGLTIQLCRNLFKYLEKHSNDEEEMKIMPVVSFLEIYNEKVRDLLDSNTDSASGKTVRVREHPRRGPYVQGLTQHKAHDPETLLNWLAIGNSNRRVSATLSNPNSSRSHSIFTITCYHDVKIHLVDLAGSERTSSGYHNIAILKEGANINKSLVALGNVISTLAEKSSRKVNSIRKRFVPYRDSTLTWLLKDILGGNSNTIVIATISPANSCYCETINTLRFGQRAKKIVTRPVVNEDPKDRTIRELRAEITRLKQLLVIQDPVSSVTLSDITVQQTEELNAIDRNSQSLQNIALPHPKQLLIKSDKLVPLLNVTGFVHVSNSSSKRAMEKRPFRTFGSQEAIPNVSKDKPKRLSQPSVALHKSSLDRLNISQRELLLKRNQGKVITKPEKGVVTEEKGPVIKKPPLRPRSEIVAAVTNRLYARAKTKEVAVETINISEVVEVPQELTICSNARSRLLELTRRALKAHRRKDVETQTDLFPVLRVKEVSTDSDDLKVVLEQSKDIETNTNNIEMTDIGTTCFLESFNEHLGEYKKYFVVTRTCGTQSQETEKPREQHSNSSISFTKYLQEKPKPSFDIVNPCAANPIYTSSVNINVSHNYIHQKGRLDTGVSDDSLDDQSQQANVYFHTPDIISNHNSLELGAITNSQTSAEEKHAMCGIIEDDSITCESFTYGLPPLCFTTLRINTDPCTKRMTNINNTIVYAVEICLSMNDNERCVPFRKIGPQLHWPTLTKESVQMGMATAQSPVVLKSNIKRQECNIELPTVSESRNLQYERKPSADSEHLLKTMSKFMDEATKLMMNLTLAANKLQIDRSYDLEVTLNDISIPVHKEQEEASSQTSPRTSIDASSNTHFPVNRYDKLVKDSCSRLEECINKTKCPTIPNSVSGGFIWGSCKNTEPVDCSSLESNQTFSDYGSLPRRTHIHPSDYLEQLRGMRQRIVNSSRGNLFSESKLNL